MIMSRIFKVNMPTIRLRWQFWCRWLKFGCMPFLFKIWFYFLCLWFLSLSLNEYHFGLVYLDALGTLYFCSFFTVASYSKIHMYNCLQKSLGITLSKNKRWTWNIISRSPENWKRLPLFFLNILQHSVR